MSLTPTAQLQSRFGLFSHIRQDFMASLVVFLVAVPLSLGIALASGAPIMAGLIAAIVGGLVVGAIGGAPLQVSGPAAGLTAIVFGLVQQFQDWRLVCAAVVVAGLIQVMLGVSRVARMCLAVSPAVVHGMLAGIGITIALAQLHVVMGGSPESKALANLLDLPRQVFDLHGAATMIGLATIAILLGWQWLPKSMTVLPPSLVAVFSVTAASVLLGLDVARIDLRGGLSNGFQFAALPPLAMWGPVVLGGLTLAAVASVESLLCAVATDKLHDGPRANLDRELVGQGLGNTISGFLGGLPITGVIVRSSANIQAGGKTQLSAILHSLWVLVFVAMLSPLIEMIPLSVLAGLLVYVGFRLVDAHHIRQLLHFREALTYGVTVGGIVIIGLLPGIALGLALAIVMLLRRLSESRIEVEQQGDNWHVRLEGSMTFVAIPRLSFALAQIPPGTKVDIDLMCDFMDHAAFETLHSWRLTHEKLGGSVDIDEMHEPWYGDAAKGEPKFGKSRMVMMVGKARKRYRRARTGEQRLLSGEDQLLNGAAEFNATLSKEVKPLLVTLANEGQTPQALFITCADSGIVPADLVNADPGDLFVVRNVGNMVPVYEDPATGNDNCVGAAVEYAIGELGIRNIVVCGHSECGAMKSLLSGAHEDLQTPLGHWLRYGTPSLDAYRTEHATEASPSAHNDLARINVIRQLENLQSYPVVAEALKEGRLRLFGWFFDLKRVKVTVWDDTSGRFVTIEEQYTPSTVMRASA
jgi:carbonic anhydrase